MSIIIFWPGRQEILVDTYFMAQNDPYVKTKRLHMCHNEVQLKSSTEYTLFLHAWLDPAAHTRHHFLMKGGNPAFTPSPIKPVWVKHPPLLHLLHLCLNYGQLVHLSPFVVPYFPFDTQYADWTHKNGLKSHICSQKDFSLAVYALFDTNTF